MNNKMVKKFFGTQTKLAVALDIKQQTVSDWVRGKIKPSIDNAKKMIELSNGQITFNDIYDQQTEIQDQLIASAVKIGRVGDICAFLLANSIQNPENPVIDRNSEFWRNFEKLTSEGRDIDSVILSELQQLRLN